MRVAIVTPVLAHYRKNLFLLLDRIAPFQVVHYSVVEPVEEGSLKINAFDPRELREFCQLKNFRLGPFLWQKGLMRMAVTRRIDACVFTGNAGYLSTWVAGLLARLTGKKVYFWTIGWHRPEVGFKRLFRLTFYRIANRLMVYGDVEKERAQQHGYPADRIDVVYNSVTSLEDVDSCWRRTEDKECIVGAVVRLNPVKKLDLLIDAVALLNAQGRKLRVVLAGTGPEREKLESHAERLGVNCEFVGAIYSPAEIAAFYRRLLITVVPSTAGLTTIQSMAHGVPVITDNDETTQAPEANAIIEGLTGSRYEAGDAEALAVEIAWWADRLEAEIGQTAIDCREEVRARWSPEVQGKRMIESITS